MSTVGPRGASVRLCRIVHSPEIAARAPRRGDRDLMRKPPVELRARHFPFPPDHLGDRGRPTAALCSWHG
jgi:hypothetical protein